MLAKTVSALLIILSLILLILTFIGERSYKDLKAIDSRILGLEEKNRELDSEIAGLNNEIYGIAESPWKLEKKSRESLGLSKPGEIVYVVEQKQLK